MPPPELQRERAAGPQCLKPAFWRVLGQQRGRLARSRLVLLGFSAMKTFPLLIALMPAAVLTGCATADFTPYVGEQQKWPTAKGAFVTTINSYDGPGRSGTGQQYTLPVYFGPPNRPYIVLGSVDIDTPVGRLFEGSAQTTTLKPAVRVAGQHGCGRDH